MHNHIPWHWGWWWATYHILSQVIWNHNIPCSVTGHEVWWIITIWWHKGWWWTDNHIMTLWVNTHWIYHIVSQVLVLNNNHVVSLGTWSITNETQPYDDIGESQSTTYHIVPQGLPWALSDRMMHNHIVWHRWWKLYHIVTQVMCWNRMEPNYILSHTKHIPYSVTG